MILSCRCVCVVVRDADGDVSVLAESNLWIPVERTARQFIGDVLTPGQLQR